MVSLSSSQQEMQELHLENSKLLEAASRLKYQVLDTFQITMGRYKDFLSGHCACHFHKVKGCVCVFLRSLFVMK